MKKLTTKIKKITGKGTPEQPQRPGRITNETVAEHREQILAGGRRFKYPMQYARNQLVRNTLLIVIGALALLALLLWWQLYPAQNTSKFFYRATQLVPMPVARIDGTFVRYSDYLMELRSALHYLEREDAVNFNSDDGRRQRTYQKRVALNKAEDNAYVQQIAKKRKITVSDKELDDFINQQLTSRKPAVSREQYEQVITDFYDWSFGEYRESVRDQLLRRKVALAIDDTARNKAADLSKQLQAGGDFAALAKAQSDDPSTKALGGELTVPKRNDDPDGLIAAAQKLAPNQVSGVIQTRSGYYLIKLLENKEADVRYARIFVDLKELESQLTKLRKDGKVSEYIDVPKDVAPTQR